MHLVDQEQGAAARPRCGLADLPEQLNQVLLGVTGVGHARYGIDVELQLHPSRDDHAEGLHAGLVGGPDVWEIVMWVEDLAGEPDPVASLVAESVLTGPQVDAALRYRAAYPDEIDARIELHRLETTAASGA